MTRFIKCLFCLCLCAFLLVGCAFDMNGVNKVVDAVTPTKLSGELKSNAFVPSDGFVARKLDFEKISFTNTANAKIYIVPSDETRVEATYPSDMEDHGFKVYYREGEIEISVPKQTNFIAEKFEITVFANIEEIEISGGIALEMDAEASKKIDIDVTGGADIYVYNINTSATEIDIDGAASLDLSGNTDILELDLAGAGSIDAKSLVCKKAEVKISGASSAALSVTDELLADIDGVGALEYYGDPIVKNISGGLTDLEQASKEIYGG